MLTSRVPELLARESRLYGTGKAYQPVTNIKKRKSLINNEKPKNTDPATSMTAMGIRLVFL